VTTRTTFVLSNDIAKLPIKRRLSLKFANLKLTPPYRAIQLLALTVVSLLAFGCTFLSPALADSDSDDWGNPIDPPPISRPKPAPAAPAPLTFKSFIPHFGKKGGRGKSSVTNTNPAAGAVEDDTRPLDTPSRPFPLLRLSRTIQTGEGGTLSPGIFLAVSGKVDANHPFGEPPKDAMHRSMTLLQRNEPCLYVTLNRDGQVDETGQAPGAPSPLTKVDPKSPPVIRVETQVSENGQSVTFLWREDRMRFRSEPYPIVLDSRPALRY
jgi:hypothetical protein